MYDNSPEHQRMLATVHFQKEVEYAYDSMFPQIVQGNADEVFGAYLSRKLTHISVSLPEGPVRTQLQAEVLKQAMLFGLDRDNDAYSAHADEHLVAAEVIERITEQMNTNPSGVRVSKNLRIFNHPSKPDENVKVPAFEVRSQPEVRTISKPMYQLYGEEVLAQCDQFAHQPDKYKNEIQKLILKAARTAGVDFAVLASLVAGNDEYRTIEIFQNQNQLEGRPSFSRSDEVEYIRKIKNELTVGENHITFNPEKLKQAQDMARKRKGWKRGRAPETAWNFVPSVRTVESVAVFGSKQYALAYLCNVKTPDFLNPAKGEYIERVGGNIATTQLITAYNIYSGIEKYVLTSGDMLAEMIARDEP